MGLNLNQEEIIQLYKTGMTQQEIADKFKCSQSTISSLLNKIYPLRHKERKFVPLNLSQEESAYIAGIVDGEGCLSFRKEKNESITPLLSVCNTNEEIIQFLKNKFDWGYKGYRDNRREKPKWILEMRGMTKLVPLILCLEKYLIIKREQAKLIKEFCESRLNRLGRKKPLTSREIEIIDKVHGLNRRGRW